MKKIIFGLILMMVLITANGCKKNEDTSFPPRISFFDIRPQVIDDNETAWMTLVVSNLDKNIALVKSVSDYGLTNPPLTSTSGNPVYIEYIPPRLQDGQTLQVTVTILVMDSRGSELDRIEGRITVEQ